MTIEHLIGTISFDGFIIALFRLLAAIALGGIIGYDREKANRPGGLRSHILICLGTMLFVYAPTLADMNDEAISRFGQGIGAFIGALALGTVIKRNNEEGKQEVVGLTTAMSFVPTAGVGIAIGLGYVWFAALTTFAVWFVLRIVGSAERKVR